MADFLQRQDETLRVLWNRSLLGFALVSVDGELLKVNNAFCEMLEYSETELLAKSFQDITHPEDSDQDVDMAEKVASGALEYYIMYKRYLTKTGSVIWIKLRVDKITSVDGEFLYFLSQISGEVVVLHEDVKDSTKKILLSGASVPTTAAKDRADLFDLLSQFVKGNLRWLIPLILGALSSMYGLYYQFQQIEARSTKNEKSVESLKTGIDESNAKLTSVINALEKLAKPAAENE